MGEVYDSRAPSAEQQMMICVLPVAERNLRISFSRQNRRPLCLLVIIREIRKNLQLQL